MICAKFGWNWLTGSGEEDFLNFVNFFFRYFLIISPWKRVGPFFWTNLNPLHPRMLCAKFGWNWPSGSWEEVENRKSLQTGGQMDIRQTHRQTTDERRSEKLTWAFSSGELKNWIKISCGYTFYPSLLQSFRKFCLAVSSEMRWQTALSSIFHFGQISKIKKGVIPRKK